MEEKEIGVVTHFFGHISVGIIQLNAPLNAGATIHIKGAHDDFIQTVDSIQIDDEAVESANEGDSVGIKVIQKVHPHDKVFMVSEPGN